MRVGANSTQGATVVLEQAQELQRVTCRLAAYVRNHGKSRWPSTDRRGRGTIGSRTLRADGGGVTGASATK